MTLDNVYMLLFQFIGNGFQVALCNVGRDVRRSRARPHRLRAVVGSARLDSCQDTPLDAAS